MSLFSAYQLRARADQDLDRFKGRILASDLLGADKKAHSAAQSYDIFLSHAFSDAKLVWGLRETLVDLGFSVYVDWIEDPTDRSNVTPAVAEQLRQRMKQCGSLLFATSSAAAESRWMPWELGYFDAHKGTVAILPIEEYTNHEDSYSGREYLGLYPYITLNPPEGSTINTLWVRPRRDQYLRFREWLAGERTFKSL